MAIRGLPVILHEQIAAHHCPILIETRKPEDPADRPVPLVTSFLWSQGTHEHPRMRYTLHVRLLSLKEVDSIFFWKDHIEQSTDFDDLLVIDVEQRPMELVGWATWASEIDKPLRDYEPSGDPLVDVDARVGEWLAKVALPKGGWFLGKDAVVVLKGSPT